MHAICIALFCFGYAISAQQEMYVIESSTLRITGGHFTNGDYVNQYQNLSKQG